MLKEFKEFAIQGNVIDLAVGVIIGGAFGKIVTSLVDDIVMPPIGLLLGKVDFKDLYIMLGTPPAGKVVTSLAEAKAAGVPVLAWGQFVSVTINFLIIAWVVFIVVKKLLNMKKEEKPA